MMNLKGYAKELLNFVMEAMEDAKGEENTVSFQKLSQLGMILSVDADNTYMDESTKEEEEEKEEVSCLDDMIENFLLDAPYDSTHEKNKEKRGAKRKKGFLIAKKRKAFDVEYAYEGRVKKGYLKTKPSFKFADYRDYKWQDELPYAMQKQEDMFDYSLAEHDDLEDMKAWITGALYIYDNTFNVTFSGPNTKHTREKLDSWTAKVYAAIPDSFSEQAIVMRTLLGNMAVERIAFFHRNMEGTEEVMEKMEQIASCLKEGVWVDDIKA